MPALKDYMMTGIKISEPQQYPLIKKVENSQETN
jgi:hypothetical protein